MTTQARRGRGRPKSSFKETTAPTMQVLDRALTVLDALANGGATTLTVLSEECDIPTATTHRILSTLQQRGYAAFDDITQEWAIGIAAYRTGTAYLNRTTLLDVSRPVMRRLMEETGETANLAVRDGMTVVFIGQVEATHPIRAFFNPGTRTAMHASGTGKAILAALPPTTIEALLAQTTLEPFTERTLATPAALANDLARTRERGWSFDREERHAGMSCIGAAIQNAAGEVIAGVSISGPSSRFADDRITLFGAIVQQAAAEITEALGGKGNEA